MFLELANKIKLKIKEWSLVHMQGKRAKYWLAGFSFSESFCFPIISDVFLIAILVVNSKRWLYYSLFVTFFSVLGGIFGYLIGYLFFDVFGQSLIDFYGFQDQMLVVAEKFKDGAFLAIFLSALTPIPYKVFTISAGFFKVNLITFVVASILGRGIRFVAVGFVVKTFGKRISDYVFKYFDYITIIILFLAMVWFVLK